MKTYFSSKLKIKISFLFIFTSLQIMSMEEEKPTKFLFAAMEYYEQGKYEEAAHIFKRYGGKPVPVAEPFCLDLVKKGYLNSFEPIPFNGEIGEQKKAHSWFHAAQKFKTLQKKNLKQLTGFLEEAKDTGNGPLLYLIGTIYEEGTKQIKADKTKAREIFLLALQHRDLRSVFGLKRVCSSEFFNTIQANGLSLMKMSQVFSLMPVLHQDEGQICASLSGFFSNFSQIFPNFLYAAAQFGHPKAQFKWGRDHCESESQSLYWMMQSAEHGKLGALGLCGYLIEHGRGMGINDKMAYAYFKRAADHPEATALDFHNFAAMHETGKGTPVNREATCEWLKKAHETDPNNKEFTSDYGRALMIAGQDEKALSVLSSVKDLNDDTACNYATILSKQASQEDDLTEAVHILSNLASKGHLNAACHLVRLINQDKIIYDDKTLRVYKTYLETAIEQGRGKRGDIANSYSALHDLYNKAQWLFDEQNLQQVTLSEKAFQFNPQNSTIRFAYAYDLKNNGQYQEALEHFFALQKCEYPVALNTIGSCYDLLSKEIQGINPSKSRDFAQKALQYYQKQIAEENDSPGKTWSAFNIYSLSCQNRIDPLPNEEIVRLLEIAIHGGDEDALNDLGAAYLFGGYGLTPSVEKAEDLLRKAMTQGCQKAKMNLMSLKFAQENKKEAGKLFQELWEEDTQKFKDFLKTWIPSIKGALKSSDEECSEKEAIYAHETSSEDGENESSLQNLDISQVISNSLTSTLSIDEESDEEKYPEDYWKQYAVPSLNQEIGEVPQLPVVLLTRSEKEQQEEKERLQRKFERLSARVEALRSTKQAKYRKIKTLMNQHIQAFGGAVKNGKGSGRRIEIGDIHSGFHQPHKSDIKGGALKSLTGCFDESAKK